MSDLKMAHSRMMYRVADDIWKMVTMKHGDPFPGIYRLHLCEPGSSPISLQRLLDVDEQGVVYVGTSRNVPRRLSELKKSVSAAYRKIDPIQYGYLDYNDPSPHQAGKKILRIRKFVERYRFESLHVSVQPHRGPQSELDRVEGDHTVLERKLLEEYEQKFGERPPLNG